MVQHTLPRKAVRFKAGCIRMGISESTGWAKTANDPDFPKPFKVGPRTTVFFEHEIDAYLELCAARSRISHDVENNAGSTKGVERSASEMSPLSLSPQGPCRTEEGQE